jgi:hypothetical protein
MAKPTRPVSKSGDGPGTGASGPAITGPQSKTEAVSRISQRAIFFSKEEEDEFLSDRDVIAMRWRPN